MSLEDSSSLRFRGYTSFLLKSRQICFVWPLGGPHSSGNLAYNKVFVLNKVSYGDHFTVNLYFNFFSGRGGN